MKDQLGSKYLSMPNVSGRPDKVEYFFLEAEPADDPQVNQLQQALIHNLPMIRDYLRRAFVDDLSLHYYVDRLYSRLRRALRKGIEITDSAIRSRLVSIVHEDRRRDRKRFIQESPTRIERETDPRSVDFVTELVRRDQLKHFRDCLDPWMRQAFDLRFSRPIPLRSKEIAARFNILRNTFDQRWRRGLESGLNEYRQRHGSGV